MLAVEVLSFWLIAAVVIAALRRAGQKRLLIPSVVGPLPRRGCKWPLEFLMFIAYALAVVLALLIFLSISGSLSNMGRR